jgi:hypothetical protein
MEGVSPRTIAVGLPERVHYAFDVEHSRLAKAWRGRFLDARGTWHARAGQLERPAGEDVIEFPQGPVIAILPSRDAPWPLDERADRVLGRTLDYARRPVFRYQVGDVEVSEWAMPQIREGGAALKRKLVLHSPSQPEVELRIAAGKDIVPGPDRSWIVHDGTQVNVNVSPEAWRDSAHVVRNEDGSAELRLHVTVGIGGFLANIDRRTQQSSWVDVEYSW